MPGALLTRPTGEPPITAAEIDDPETLHLGQHGPQRRPLRGGFQPSNGAWESAVSFEEGRVVVDILGHAERDFIISAAAADAARRDNGSGCRGRPWFGRRSRWRSGASPGTCSVRAARTGSP